MNTWLMDTTLCKWLASRGAATLQQWCEANNASLFLSTVSLTEISACIAKTPQSRWRRRDELRIWLDDLASRFADRIHALDASISMRAGEILPRLVNGHPRHRLHDAVLLATAQAHGHILLTRRDGVFGPWTETPVEVI